MKNHITMKPLAALLAIACVLLAAASAQASTNNLLQNGNFNLPLAGSWNTWTYGGGWAGPSTNPDEVYDGTQFVYMGGNDGGGGGVNQTLSAQPDVPYTISCVSAVSAWWWPEAQMRLIFQDATNGTLLLAATNCAASITNNDTGLAWSNYTLTATSPPGTVKVMAEFACYGHGTVRFDNAYLTSPLDYPEITDVYPDGSVLEQATNTLSFSAGSPAGISNSAVQVMLNGVDVSASLVITGPATNLSVSYPNLEPNQTYSGVITVTDEASLYIVRNVVFDTFDPVLSWEAEDYDFNSGMFIDNPVLSSTPDTNNYYQQVGTLDVDYHDAVGNGPLVYRPYDLMGTEVTADAPRQAYLTAKLGDTNVADYNLAYFDAGEWLNYTRTIPSGVFNVYARMSSPGSATLNLARVTSGWGTTSQTVQSIGNFNLDGGQGWGTFQWVPLRDANGSLVKLNLSGTNTLRATTSGNCNAQFFMLVAANTNLPTIVNVYPNGSTLLQATNTFSFTAESEAGFNPEKIQVTLSVTNPTTAYTTNLNGTNGLVLSGPATSQTASFAGLLTNTRYQAVITVTDLNNNITSTTLKFDTYAPVLTWEAEDWDFGYGQFIDNPQLNAYANQAGVEGVDYHDINASGGFPYRPSDYMSAEVTGDVPRSQYVAASTNDYVLGWFVNGEWVNYTRTIPSGTYNVYGRFAAGEGTSYQSLSVVTNGWGTSSQELSQLGTFNINNTGGWSAFGWVPLRDQFGNLAAVTLSGTNTLRLARAGGSDANVNFFMLLPAETSLPTITQVTPLGFMQSTNKLAFTVASAAGVATNNIGVVLNGINVSSSLVFSGSSTSWSVNAGLAPNTVYSAVINVTNNSGAVATSTIYFDTFSATGYSWEAEDWDFNGGQFFDAPQTNAYLGQAGVAEIDLLDSDNGGPKGYRYGDPAATEAASDYLRPQFDGTGMSDYNIGYTEAGEWLNYTRSYPTGTFNVYLRAARGAGGTAPMGLAKVTSGWGTTNQTAASLGSFAIEDTGGWQSYRWVPLKNGSGQLVNVTLGGTNTLRLTDGGANVNFFTLVPALALQGSLNGAQMQLSFGTQAGFAYTVQYKTNLTDSGWLPLSTVSGDGTTKTVMDPLATSRYYRLLVH